MKPLFLVVTCALFLTSMKAQVVEGNYEMLDTDYQNEAGQSVILHKVLSIHSDGSFELEQLEPEKPKKSGSHKGTWKLNGDFIELNTRKLEKPLMILRIKEYQLVYTNKTAHVQEYNLLDD